MADKNASLIEGAESSRNLLAARGQEVADLIAEAAAEAASAGAALSEMEGRIREDKRAARAEISEIVKEAEAAAAVAREAEERSSEEIGEGC